jgi:hypothetical protein
MRLSWVVLGFVLLTPGAASADRNDLTLERLIGMPGVPGMFNDPSNPRIQSQYRSLLSELGTVMSPNPLTPADTLGYSGFHLSLDSTFTSINNQADYWQKGVRDVSGSFLPTVTVLARKGLWAPTPSFEFGAGGTYLVDSSIFGLVLYLKLGIHEGFHNFPMPSIALKAGVTRLIGTSQTDLTVVSTDLTVSKSFGVAGTFKLDPFIGANLLVMIARSQVIDTTPNIDAYKQGPMSVDLNSNTTFPDQDNILRWRLFLGMRLVYSLLALTFQYAITFCNDTATNCLQDDGTRIFDRSDHQHQLSISAGLIF